MNKFKILVGVLILIFNQLSFGRGKFIQYPSDEDSVILIEKVYLHIDRENYLAGDDIWFKAYLIDALDHLLTDHSNNLHVELISPSSKIISSRIIRLEGGLGNGDFKIPADIMSGRYRLRAYTNYMRNFSDQLFFCKEITIVNANDNGQDEISDKVKYVENKIIINFFPEGGSLVNNVSSIVAFKAVNNLGVSCDVSGKIYSSNGDLITTFKSTHLGMGKFFLRPSSGLKYYSIIRGGDSIDIRTELPTSFPKGVTFSAAINQDNEILITTKTNSETLALISEHDILLSISIRKEVINTIPFRIKSPITNFVVPAGYLPEGILMLTLTTREDLPLSERLIYIEKEAPLKMLIETDKNFYKKREKVNLKISLSGDSTVERTGNVSLAAIDETFTNNTSQYPRNISSWFLLESDIRGNVEDPSNYFDPTNADRLKNLDLLLLTQGWRDFSWKYDTVNYPTENGFMISGRLRNFYKNKPIEGSRVSVGIFGNTNSFFTTIPVDSTGRFNLSGVDITGEARLIVSGIDQKDRMKGLLILDSLKYNPAKVSDSLTPVFILTENKNSKLKSYYTINEEILKKYKLSDTIRIGEVNIISERHKDPQTEKVEKSRSKYGTPEGELIITEQMKSYNSLPELISGRFPGVEVLKGGIIRIRGAFSFQKDTINPDGTSGILPLILVDGNPVPYEEINYIPVNYIERIDVLKSVGATSVFGMRASSGVINLITRTGEDSEIKAPVEYSTNIRFSGYNEPRIFYSPQHLQDSNSDINPDLRSTIYWKPNIKLEGTSEVILNYYNGDNSSLIRIIAEGITDSGIPVTGKAEYEVR
ncbi:MAG: TonB-dependent receptor plug domain-containing protein [Bacteroidales bacterium]|nr:TonB-dependent receptor plug domain-containing protein [Bacteroidales bacterium]